MARLLKCDSHFIRCIKSNQEKKAMLFDKSSVQSQLQTGGVITAVEVSRSGFGIREKHSSFLESYAGLLEGERQE